MALSTVTITGRAPFPDDATPVSATIEFVLSGYDTEGADVIVPERRTFDLVAGVLPSGVDLWPNVAGLRGTIYKVFIHTVEADQFGGANVTNIYTYGSIQIPETPTTQTLASLLNSPTPAVPGAWYSSITEAEYQEVIDAVDATAADRVATGLDRVDANAAATRAEAAADDAAGFAGYRQFKDVATMISNTSLDYSGDGAVVAGDVITIRDSGYVYEVATLGATDQHLSTDGGVKLYALPNDSGAVFAGQLGWVAGADASAAMVSFLAARPDGITGLIFDALYLFQGSGYTIPPNITRFEAADYSELPHGENATLGLSFMDANPQTAAVFGLSHVTGSTFDVPSGFSALGLKFNDASVVDETLLVNGNNREEVFNSTDVAQGICVDKCRFDQAGGIGIEVLSAPYWQVTDCWVGRLKYWLQIKEASHYGLFQGNRGKMGFIGLNVSGTGTQVFGDYIKTTADNNVGPRYCVCSRNVFVNDYRDGPDGTGGFGGWVFDRNYFEVSIAGIDIKCAYNTAADLDEEERLYSGIRITNNVFYGCGLVYTSTWNVANVGEPFDQDRQIRNIVCDGNVYYGKIGKPYSAHYSKSTSHITCTNEQFLPVQTDDAGSWDAGTGVFPSNSVYGTHYVVSGAGTVDGQAFSVGNYLRPLVDNASTLTLEGNWHRSTVNSDFVGMYPIKLDDGGSTGIMPSNISMTNVHWDSRGAPSWTLLECSDIDLHFKEMITDGSGAVTFSAPNINISGRVKAIDRPLGSTSSVDIFTVSTGADNVRFDVQHECTGTVSNGALVRIIGACQEIYIDGSVNGGKEVIDLAGAGNVTGLYMGARSRLNISNLTSTILTNGGASNGIFFGEVSYGDLSLYSSEPNLHNMGKLMSGLGFIKTISGGVIRASNSVHKVDTEAAAASDDLVTINGGALGDRIVITAADSARTVVAKDGTGNLILGADRTLDNVADTLVLEKRGDGNWHQLSFDDLGA